MTTKILPKGTIAPVIKTVTVDLSIERAFHLFTEEVSRWWPLRSHSVGGDDALRCILEGYTGGRFYEVLNDGRESEWGRVTVWEPPQRLALDFYPGRTPEAATQLEVRFEQEGERTRLILTHQGWEIFGLAGNKHRDAYHTGWDTVLEEFIQAAQFSL